MKFFLCLNLLILIVSACSQESDQVTENSKVDVSNTTTYAAQMADLDKKLRSQPDDISLLLQSANLALENYD